MQWRESTGTVILVILVLGLIEPITVFGEGHRFQIKVSNVSMNRTGSNVTVSPSSAISISFDYQIWNSDTCPACIAQIVIGIDNTAMICAYNGIPGVYPGKSGTAKFSITAPTSPGTYSLIYAGTLQYNCEDAKNCYNTNTAVSQKKQVIGTITVTETPSEDESQPSSVEIWIDKGCGGYYEHGDPITIYYEVTSPASTATVTLVNRTPDGRIDYKMKNQVVSTNTIHTGKGTIECPGGVESVEIMATVVVGGQIIELKDECYWYVGGCSDPCENVQCGTVCRGHELYQQKCQDGECVDDYRIERDSEECGACPSGYDPEKSNCGPKCPDSDNDGVPDCKDRCPETPADLLRLLGPVLANYTDSEGCVGCYDEIRRCALSLLTLALPPTFGIEEILIDFCEITYRIAQGDWEGVEKYAIKLTYDVQITVAKLLGAVIANVWGATATKIYEAIEDVHALYGCVPAVLDSLQILSSYEMALQDLAGGGSDILSFFVGSPVHVEIEDDYGNILNESNKNGIPNSYLLSIGNEKVVIIAMPKSNYKINVKGTQEGTYDLRIDRVHGGRIASDKYEDMHTSKREVDTYNVHTSSDGQIDVSREKATSPTNKYLLSIFAIISVMIILALIYRRRGRKKTISYAPEREYLSAEITRGFPRSKRRKRLLESSEKPRLQKKKDIQESQISEEDPSTIDTRELSRHERRKVFFESLAEELSEMKKKREDN